MLLAPVDTIRRTAAVGSTDPLRSSTHCTLRNSTHCTLHSSTRCNVNLTVCRATSITGGICDPQPRGRQARACAAGRCAYAFVAALAAGPLSLLW